MSAIGKPRQAAALARRAVRPGPGPAHLIERELANIEHGRFERALSGLTAAAALITTPQMIGRCPDYDVLDSAGTWDEATKKVVLARLDRPGALRFFTAEEEPALRAFCDTALAQDREPRVPVAESVDAKLADGRLDGFQYADMPDDRDTWRLVLRGLDEVAQARYGKPGFAAAERETREAIIGQFAGGTLAGGTWDKLNVSRAWSVCMRSVLSGFYSHPWAWNEIGFGGPAYPRGFMRLGPVSTTEPFERHGATGEDPARLPGLDGGHG